MSIIFADNFSNYGSDTGYLNDGLYANVGANLSLVIDPDGASPGYVIRTSDGTFFKDELRFVLPGGAETTVGVNFRLFKNTLPISGVSTGLFAFSDASNTEQISLDITPTGTLGFYRGTTLVAGTAVPVISTGSWNNIEAKVTFSQTVGAVELRINEVTVISATNVDTCNTALEECSQVSFCSSGVGSITHFKDFILWDTSGTQNNDFLGDCSVVTMRPASDIALNWVPSTGATGYDLIDEAVPNDADYIIADATPPAAYECSLTDLPSDIVTVKALLPFSRSLKTDSGTANEQLSLISNAAADAGTDRPVTVAATYRWDVSEIDPDTTTAWTPISANAATLKIDRTI